MTTPVTLITGASAGLGVEFARQLRDTLPLAVRVDYGTGKMVVHGTEQPEPDRLTATGHLVEPSAVGDA